MPPSHPPPSLSNPLEGGVWSSNLVAAARTSQRCPPILLWLCSYSVFPRLPAGLGPAGLVELGLLWMPEWAIHVFPPTCISMFTPFSHVTVDVGVVLGWQLHASEWPHGQARLAVMSWHPACDVVGVQCRSWSGAPALWASHTIHLILRALLELFLVGPTNPSSLVG